MKFLTVFFALVFCGSAFSATLNHQPKISLDVDGKLGNSNVLYKEVCGSEGDAGIGGVISIEIHIENLDSLFVSNNNIDIITVHFDYSKAQGSPIYMANMGVFSGSSYEYLHTSRFDENYDEYALFGYSNSEVLSSKVLSRDNGYVGYVDFIIVRRISERFLYISVRKVELKSSKGDFKWVLTTDDKVEVRVKHIGLDPF